MKLFLYSINMKTHISIKNLSLWSNAFNSITNFYTKVLYLSKFFKKVLAKHISNINSEKIHHYLVIEFFKYEMYEKHILCNILDT